MKNLITISAVLGIILGTQSAVAIPLVTKVSQAEASEQTPNQMMKLLNDWGFESSDCQENVINMKHDVTGEIGCAVPNQQIPAGNFIYNSAENTISPIETQASNQAETEPQTPAIDDFNAAETQKQNALAQKFVFDFDNAYDYSACLDVILLAYEKRSGELENVAKNKCANDMLNTFGTNLSKDAALKLIESADVHATEVLENPLYPVLGIRRRVAINLGYIYDIDENNSDILELMSSQLNH